MLYGRTTFSKFIIEDQRRMAQPDPQLTALLNDIQTACKHIAAAVAQGRLQQEQAAALAANGQGEEQKPLDLIANEIMLRNCEWGGELCGMLSEEMEAPYAIPRQYPRGEYLLLFDPLDGSSNLDVAVTVGTIFSVLRAPEGMSTPGIEDFLQPGTSQVCAGYALYGPVTMLVVTMGRGVHGFTLDPAIGAFTLTHPDMRIPESSREFAINASNARFWEPPVRRYVDECVKGKTGPRADDFSMRWIACLVAEVHRILVRGGLFMYPRDTRDSTKPGRLRLLYEANPMALLIEQAGGSASTGRARLLDIAPTALHQRIPVVLGSKHEVERLERYHREYDAGEDREFESPLFNVRSLFRAA